MHSSGEEKYLHTADEPLATCHLFSRHERVRTGSGAGDWPEVTLFLCHAQKIPVPVSLPVLGVGNCKGVDEDSVGINARIGWR